MQEPPVCFFYNPKTQHLPHEGISRGGDGTQKDGGDGELHGSMLSPVVEIVFGAGGDKQRQDQPTTRKQGDSSGAECVRGGSAGCLALKGL